MTDYTSFLDKLIGSAEITREEQNVVDVIESFQEPILKLFKLLRLDQVYHTSLFGVGSVLLTVVKVITFHPRSVNLLPSLNLLLKGLSVLAGTGLFGPSFTIFALSGLLVWAKSWIYSVGLSSLVGLILGLTSYSEPTPSVSHWPLYSIILIIFSVIVLLFVIVW